MYRIAVFVHLVGVFGFLMAHGVSVYATFGIRKERDPERVAQLLELSGSTVPYFWTATSILLLGGVVAGFLGDWWGQLWIWGAIAVLVAVTFAMYAIASPYFTRIRRISQAMVEGTEAVSEEQFVGILRSSRPFAIATVGFGGLLVILYLMMFKPGLGLAAGESACPAPAGDGGPITICAPNDQAFATDRLSVPAGEPFELVFVNADSGVQHNVAIYVDDSADRIIFAGDLVEGVATVTYHVPAIDAGTHYFRCDLHPQMNGSLEAA